MPFTNKRIKVPWFILGVGQNIYKVRVEYFIVQVSKKMFKTN